MSLNILEATLASKLKGDSGQQLPEVTSADNGKALVVQNGEWTAADVQSANLGTLNATENSTYYASDDGYDGYSEVTVDVPSPELVSLLAEENMIYYPSSYYADGFSDVQVNVSLPVVVPLEVYQNGVYYPGEYQADAFSMVDVSVSSSTLTSLVADENKVYYPGDYSADGFSEVTVNVPTGGNPNEYYTFTGTVDDPTGGAVSDYSDVINGVNSANMTVFMHVDENTTLGTPELTFTSVRYLSSQLSLITGTLDSQLSSCNVAQIVYDANGLVSAIAIQSGTVLDLTAYASMLTCTLTVFVHPVPD